MKTTIYIPQIIVVLLALAVANAFTTCPPTTHRSNTSPTTTRLNYANGRAEETTLPRDQAFRWAAEEAMSMNGADLNSSLINAGIQTSGFFDREEYIAAYARAVADGLIGFRYKPPVEAQQWDPTYRDVHMQSFDPRSVVYHTVIDTVATPTEAVATP